MATSMSRPSSKTASRSKMAAATPTLSDALNSGLNSSFEAIRDKISQTVTENGEEYLKEAAAKIAKSTSQVVEWSKKNPIKLAIGVAALMAVSAFLVHTMSAHAAGTTSSSSPRRAPAKARAAKA